MPSGDLEKSLRDDIEAHVGSRIGGLREEVTRLQSQFNEAFTRLLERIESAASGGDASIAVAVSEHMLKARNEGIERAASGSARARSSSEVAILKAAIDDLDAQRTQADILNALVNRAAAFAPRVAFFVIKNERATGWRARGLEGTVGDDAVREISLPLSADTLLSAAARTQRAWSGGPGSHAEDNAIFGSFGDEPPQRVVAVPMIAREKPVAVLYADSAGQDSDAINLEALETLVRVAGMAVELLATKRPAAPAASAQAPAPREQQPESRPSPRVEAQPPAESYAAEPEPAAYEEPAAAPASHSFSMPPAETDTYGSDYAAESAHASAVSEPAYAEAPPAPAAEAPAPAPAQAESAAAPQTGARRYGASDAEFPVEVSEADRRFHNEARRFARLLVSEIKLYNEQKVTEGRAGGDLYNRLRDDIDRSRQMYDKRVKPEVAGSYDYFHHELVNTLAEGDQSKLGDGYPGAMVSV